MKIKKVGITFIFALIPVASFAEEAILDLNGYVLDYDYYSANEDNSQQLRTARKNSIFNDDFVLKVLSKGAYTYNMKVTWSDAEGHQSQFSRNSVFSWVPLTFTIPKGARNVFLNTIVNDGFYGTPAISASITPESVKQGQANFTEYHMWGSTFWPKWRQID
ncbi:hypothetical protein [Aliivibrio fischeri]|uniref:DUF2207 domain-containing protein n=1 Tax=Aliivibrio fischeri TaxID=668 RepID=A0A510URQ7_ALIFS|nr:hypothetical protein [Aliivibrio fischeri]MUK51414.1 hypothetical protein [Aliivibrio fischeri]GEK16151.1 hypothetical protein AFI02nite_41870 [Aliivibrio fischeri]